MNSETNTQLHGYKLILARTAWIVITTMALVLWIADIQPGYTQYLTVCTLIIVSKPACHAGHGTVTSLGRAVPTVLRPLHYDTLSRVYAGLFRNWSHHRLAQI